MSLVQHVSALEGIDREPEPDAVEEILCPVRRKISYDVLQPPSQSLAVDHVPGTPAYKHSPVKRFGEAIPHCVQSRPC